LPQAALLTQHKAMAVIQEWWRTGVKHGDQLMGLMQIEMPFTGIALIQSHEDSRSCPLLLVNVKRFLNALPRT